jgi:hypothetical protein
VERLFKETQKDKKYEQFFKEMKRLWDLAVSTHYWPQDDFFETEVQEAHLCLKIPRMKETWGKIYGG